ncbi:hypothetical protein AB0P28_05960 [Pseudarthrobacter sp. NPDC089323]
MARTREAGLKAAATNRKRYGDGTNGEESFYSQIGRKVGKVSKGERFAVDHDFAVEMGRKGGSAVRNAKKA